MALERKNIGTEAALRKIKHFCGYQERTHTEVKEKLYGYGLYKTEAEEMISRLIEEDYLNEERFAVAFAGGKFRMKQWGKTKIKYELKQKKISDYCIKKGLAAIDEGDYRKTLLLLFEKKSKELKSEKNIFIKKKKLQNYLMGKGYEFEMIAPVVNGIG